MTESMIPVSKLTELTDRWAREVQGTDGGYWDAKQDCIHAVAELVSEAVPSVADGVELFRQQLLTGGVVEPVAAELATMQECLKLLNELPADARTRAARWLDDRIAHDRANGGPKS